MCGRLAHGFGYGRAGNAVLSGRDPVRNALARHLQRVEADEEGKMSDFSFLKKKIKKEKKKNTKNNDNTNVSSCVFSVPGWPLVVE